MTPRAALRSRSRSRPIAATRARSPERAAARAFVAAARALVEEDAGGSGEDASRAAFAWVHLVAAIRMMEARGLVADGVARGARSSGGAGFGRFLAEFADREIGGAIACGARSFEPSPRTLGRLAALASSPRLDATWIRDDALGNVFQDFGEIERARALARLAAGAELGADAIRAATRIFTPRWIVRALVENSLGRLWVSMHPSSPLVRSMRYLVPRDDLPRAEPRPASDISFLDPACGAMHFGLAAFDLFEAMHREERRNAGLAGWPRAASVEPSRVAAMILESNVAGADVDPDSIEIAALALRLRARRSDANTPPLARVRLALANEGPAGVGSLRPLPAPLGESHDIVATNPPYLGRRHLPAGLREALRTGFEPARGDLCAAFVLRALSLLREGGRAAILSQQSFLFTSGYERLRRRLRDLAAPEWVARLGTGVFDEIGGEKVNSALVVLRRDGNASTRSREKTVFVRVGGEPGPEAKRIRIEAALDRLRRGKRDTAVHRARVDGFDAIPGAPWVDAMPPRLRSLFATRSPLGATADVSQGLATTDNARFVRHWFEVGHAAVEWDAADGPAARRSGKRWFPYAKGGGERRWVGRIDLVVDWENDGAAVKRAIAERYPYLGGRWEWVAKNSGRYFRGGITYSALSPGRFSARLLPRGAIFDVAGSAIFARGTAADERFLLGILNSSIANRMLAHLNPTVNVQVGDLLRLPVPRRDGSSRLVDLVGEAVALARESAEEDETDPAFVEPPAGEAALLARRDRLRDVETRIDREAARLYGVGPGLAREPGAASRADAGVTSAEDIAHLWISYAVGIALGRYVPGRARGPGRGRATPAVAARLRDLATDAGFLVLDDAREPGVAAGDHEPLRWTRELGLASRVHEILRRLRGDAGVERIAAAVGRAGDSPRVALRAHLGAGFFGRHSRAFQSRPVYLCFRAEKSGAAGFYAHHDRLDAALLERVAREITARVGGASALSPEYRRFTRRLDAIASRGEIPSRDAGTIPRLDALRSILAEVSPARR